ncbi:hypothetical protein, partial [Roseimaritima sediminicola]|uniref:hypothetical protein n=1 Tax=Roseimaritima sediminicola TaxID=2662066 RepID=UPI0013871AF8
EELPQGVLPVGRFDLARIADVNDLRNGIGTLADGMAPLREEAQVQKLMKLIGEAREQKQTPVLSSSRDGVALGLAPWSLFEMASVACVSVLAAGTKLGTVYLGSHRFANGWKSIFLGV